MSIENTTIIKGVVIAQEETLTPKKIVITPGGTAGTTTTITSTQTSNISVDLKNLAGLTEPITTTYVRVDSKAQPSGVASLDVTGKIPNSQLPTTAMEWFGNWDASTNTPTLTDGIGSPGDTYRAAVAGTVDFGSGPIVFNISDWVTYSGTVWQQSPSPGAVSNVFGRTGAIVAQSGDYTKAQVGLSNVDNTSDADKPVSTAQATAISMAMPTGSVIAYAALSYAAPTGWYTCDGSLIDGTSITYSALYAIIGTTYNTGGEPANFFRTPNLIGRTIISAGSYTDPVSGAITRNPATALGAEKHVLTTGELATHSHTDAGHSHTINVQTTGVSGSFGGGFGETFQVGTASTSVGFADIGNAGSNTAHNNMQPSLVLHYIIKL